MTNRSRLLAEASIVALTAGHPIGAKLPEPLLTESEAARVVRLSPRTLQRKRVEGSGPRYVQLSERRIAYAIGELQSWLRERSVSSTSEATARALSVKTA